MKKEYFDNASDWALERVEMAQVTACRWQLGFWIQTVCLVLALLGLIVLLPLKTVEPLIIQKDLQTGEVFVSPGEKPNLTKTQQETESDAVRYVIARETYSPIDQEIRFRQVQYMSSQAVFSPYMHEHEASNEESFESILGDNGLRTVKVEDVIFLDPSDPMTLEKNKQHILPIVKVDFVTTERINQQVITHYWVATIKFEYFGTPDTKEAAWANYDGFTVTSYRVDQRNKIN